MKGAIIDMWFANPQKWPIEFEIQKWGNKWYAYQKDKFTFGEGVALEMAMWDLVKKTGWHWDGQHWFYLRAHFNGLGLG